MDMLSFWQNLGTKVPIIIWAYLAVIRPPSLISMLAKNDRRAKTNSAAKIQPTGLRKNDRRIQTCPTTPKRVLLDLIVLHLQVKREARMWAIKLERKKFFQLGDLVGHLQILKKLVGLEELTHH